MAGHLCIRRSTDVGGVVAHDQLVLAVHGSGVHDAPFDVCQNVLVHGDGLVDLLLGPGEFVTVDPVSLAKEALELHLFVREPRLVLIIRPPLDVGRGEAGFEFLVCQRLEGRALVEAVIGLAVVWIYIGHKGNRIYLSFNVVHIRFQVGGGGKDRHRPDDKRRRQKQGDDRDFSRFIMAVILSSIAFLLK